MAANDEQVSDKLTRLTALSEMQSRAFMFDYGMPKRLPSGDILSQGSFDLAGNALSDSHKKVDLWATADGVMEVGIALAGLLGGAYGLKVAGYLTAAKSKSKALIAGQTIRRIH